MSFCTPPSRGPQRRISHNLLNRSTKAARTPFKSPLRQDNPGDKKEIASDDNLVKDIEILKQKERELDEQISELVDQGYKEEELGEHIEKLHEYNEIKDVGQMIIGRIAMELGTTTKEIYSRYELDLED